MHLDSPKKKKVSMVVDVEFLPDVIIVNILSRLPLKSILEYKCICKAWITLIHDPFFLATYHARQSFFAGHGDGDVDSSESLGFFIMGRRPEYRRNASEQEGCFKITKPINSPHKWFKEDISLVHYAEYRRNASEQEGCFKVTKPINSPHKWFKEDISATWNLIGSSNGLICLSACCPVDDRNFTYTIYIYNPMTKEYVNLGPETFAAGYRAMGFGYHPSTNEYKVIRINYPSRDSPGQVKVYTLGGNTWRDKGEIPYVFPSLYQPGVLVNGGLHWLTNGHKIVCFDLADEEFRNVTVPPCISQHHSPGVLGGRLCVYQERRSVWVLKEYYMMDESWTRIFSRDDVNGPFKEEDVVLRSCGSSAFVSNFLYERRNVVSYDSVSGSNSFVSNNIEWFDNYSRLDIVSYVKSFVSLKALGEKDVQYS